MFALENPVSTMLDGTTNSMSPAPFFEMPSGTVAT